VRETLAKALSELLVDITVVELNIEEAKERYGCYFSSPTILLNEKDLFGDKISDKLTSSS